MSYDATDAEIAAQFFNTETVPGDNTVPTAKNTLFKNRAQGFVNGRSETLTTQNKNDLFLFAYGKYLKGEFVINQFEVDQILGNNLGVPMDMTYKSTELNNEFGPGGMFYE
jgi:hypothetical protein